MLVYVHTCTYTYYVHTYMYIHICTYIHRTYMHSAYNTCIHTYQLKNKTVRWNPYPLKWGRLFYALLGHFMLFWRCLIYLRGSTVSCQLHPYSCFACCFTHETKCVRGSFATVLLVCWPVSWPFCLVPHWWRWPRRPLAWGQSSPPGEEYLLWFFLQLTCQTQN